MPVLAGPSVRSFVRPSVCYQSCEHDISKTDEPILLQIGTSGPLGKGTNRSTFGVTRSEVKITRRRG